MKTIWWALLVVVLLAGCGAPADVYYQRATLTAGAATGTREAQYGQATLTVAAMQQAGTAAAAAAADAETRLLLARATQTVIAAGTSEAAGATAAAVREAARQGTAEAVRVLTAQAFVREGWTATVQAEERAATREAVVLTQAADRTGAAVSATYTAQAMGLLATLSAAEIQARATAAAAGAGMVVEQLAQERVLTAQADAGKFWWVAIWLVAALAAIALGSLTWLNLARTRAITQVVQRGSMGESPVVLIGNRAVAPDQSMYPVMDPARPVLPPVDAQLQLAMGQTVVRGMQSGGRTLPPSSSPQIPAGAGYLGGEGEVPMAVAWREVSNRQPGTLLLGAGARGLVMARQDTPHVLMAGQTGSGKSTGMRAIIAQHLLDGRRVTILDKSGRDFGVFEEWATVITLDASDPARAVGELIGYMRAAWMEVLRRQKSARPVWQGVVDVLVVDELDNWQDVSFDTDTSAKRLWQYPRMISKEGRGSGIFLLAASQNPTAASIDIGMRRNCTPVAFRLADPAASQIILGCPDAVGLRTGQFIAGLEERVRGVGFNPSDGEIRETLRGVRGLGRAEWLSPSTPLPASPQNPCGILGGGEGEDWREVARAMAAEGMRTGRIAVELRRNYYQVREALEGGEVGGSSSSSSGIASGAERPRNDNNDLG